MLSLTCHISVDVILNMASQLEGKLIVLTYEDVEGSAFKNKLFFFNMTKEVDLSNIKLGDEDIDMMLASQNSEFKGDSAVTKFIASVSFDVPLLPCYFANFTFIACNNSKT
jgi:hypothetical protein